MKIDSLLKNLLSTTKQINEIQENKNDKESEADDLTPNFAIADLVNATDEEVVFLEEAPEDLNFISTAHTYRTLKTASTAGKKENALRDRLSKLAEVHQEAMNYHVGQVETNSQAELPLEIEDKNTSADKTQTLINFDDENLSGYAPIGSKLNTLYSAPEVDSSLSIESIKIYLSKLQNDKNQVSSTLDALNVKINEFQTKCNEIFSNSNISQDTIINDDPTYQVLQAEYKTYLLYKTELENSSKLLQERIDFYQDLLTSKENNKDIDEKQSASMFQSMGYKVAINEFITELTATRIDLNEKYSAVLARRNALASNITNSNLFSFEENPYLDEETVKKMYESGELSGIDFEYEKEQNELHEQLILIDKMLSKYNELLNSKTAINDGTIKEILKDTNTLASYSENENDVFSKYKTQIEEIEKQEGKSISEIISSQIESSDKTKIEGTTITFANGTKMDYKKNGTLRSFTPTVNSDGSVTFTKKTGSVEETYVYNENGKKVQHNYDRKHGLDEKHSYNEDGKEIYTQRTNEKGVIIFERSSLNGNHREYSEVQHDYNGNLTISRITDTKEINTCLVNYAAKFIQFKVNGIMISLGGVDGITRDKEFTKDMLKELVDYAQSMDIKHYPNVEQQNQLKTKVKELLQ